MSTATVVGTLVATWVVLGLALAWLAVVSARRARRAQEAEQRASHDLAVLRELAVELEAEVARLRESIRETAAAQAAAGAGRPGPRPRTGAESLAGEVPLITHIAESDDVDLTTARVASVTLAGPLMKAAALTYGVRHALHEEQRMRISYAMRKELRRQRKMRRRRRSERRRSEGWVP